VSRKTYGESGVSLAAADAVVGRLRAQPDLVERDPLTVQEELPAQRVPVGVGPRRPVADQLVERHRVRPAGRILGAQSGPLGVRVEWTPQARAPGSRPQTVLGEVGDAVAAPPAQIEQRERVAHVRHVRVPRPMNLIDRDTDRYFGDQSGRDPSRVRIAEPAPHLRLDRSDLVFRGAYLHQVCERRGDT
jgi:hypothetical protein